MKEQMQATDHSHGEHAISTDILSLSSSARDSLVVSAIKVNGKLKVVSHYGDDSWRLVGGATNVHPADHTLNLTKIPKPFRATMKAMLYRYITRGDTTGRPPKHSACRQFFWESLPFFRYILSIGIEELRDVKPLVFMNYVHAQKANIKERGGKLAKTTLQKRFRTVERICRLSQYSTDPAQAHPWPNSSANVLAGISNKGIRYRENAKTPIIPDDTFSALFRAAWLIVEGAPRVLDLRDELDQLEQALSHLSKQGRNDAKNAHLQNRGWSGGLQLHSQSVIAIRTACYIVVASLSGCRNHEIGYIQTGACYSTEGDEGETYYWLRTRSEKTDVGETTWMIPEAVVTALKVMDRWAVPYQSLIKEEVSSRRAKNPNDTEIAEAERHSKAVFLGVFKRLKIYRCRTISLRAVAVSLDHFVKVHGITWNLATHQFRRTFAHYVARSQFGDIRYLKEHFKHWSIDMTLLYSLSDRLEESLFEEISAESSLLRENKIDEWLTPDAPLAGGAGRSFMKYRGSDAIVIFKDRKHMVRTLAQSIEIRSTGHSWCSAHHGIECVGNGGLERIRCADCDHSVIGLPHARIWQGLHHHLSSLLSCTDVGDAALERVRRDVNRCEEVLRDLGYDLDKKETA